MGREIALNETTARKLANSVKIMENIKLKTKAFSLYFHCRSIVAVVVVIIIFLAAAAAAAAVANENEIN